MAKNSEITLKDPLIVLIDKNTTARRAAIVREAVADLIREENDQDIWKTVSVKTFAPSEQSEVAVALTGHNCAIALIIIDEKELSTLTDGERIPRLPCESVLCGYRLIGQMGSGNDLFFVVRGDIITGVDVISMLLSGIRGVIDINALGSPGVLKTLVNATQMLDKRLNRLVVGRPYELLDSLITMARIKWQISMEHWALLLALAEIPLLKLPSEYPPKQNKIAQEVSAFEGMTGYLVNSSTQRKLPLILDMVGGEIGVFDNDELTSEEERLGRGRYLDREEMFELPYLPLYAREIGMPSRLLPIRELDQSQLATWLYKGFRFIEIRSTQTYDNIPVVQITMPRNF